MIKDEIVGGTVHEMPADLKKALTSVPAAREEWESLSPLARNEWICWNISVKQPETRKNHIERTITELQEGKRRPCCWLGCIHRKDKEISPSVRWVLDKQSKIAKPSAFPSPTVVAARVVPGIPNPKVISNRAIKAF